MHISSSMRVRPSAFPSTGLLGSFCALACALACVLSCAQKPAEPDDKKSVKGAAAAAQPVEVLASRPDLRFTFLGKEGKFQLAQRAADVPKESRGAVMVVDLSQTRADSDLVSVVDLRHASPDEKYLATPMERPAFERLARGLMEQERPPVIMYATTWCGVCRRARGFLKQHGVAFVEKDVEKEPGVSAELRAKAQKAGVEARGVPVFDVAGNILPGFDEGALKRLLKL